MKTRTTILTLALITSLTCFGWGQKGHDVVAYIAECHLTPNAKAAVEAALDGKSIVYYANWLDNASHQPEYAYSKTWHYKNIDADKTYETMSLNHRGDIVTALNEQIAKLQAGGLSHTDEALALKMVVHLVGDVHQPMHLGHLSDLGGNRWSVTYFGRERNL
ncbi:MAG: S1/P1 nuclease, partial [Candidatus Limisoma sp.]|nr:S1/P1 nuclease [Candidatus Limisoma sp.]